MQYLQPQSNITAISINTAIQFHMQTDYETKFVQRISAFICCEPQMDVL